MDFTPLYPHSSSSSSTVSPNGVYVLTSVGDRLVVRVTQSMEVIRSWKFDEEVIKAESRTNLKTSQSQPHRVVSSSSAGHQAKSSTRSNEPIPSLSNPTAPPTIANTRDERRSPVLTSILFSPNSQFACALFRQPTTSVVRIYSIESDQLAAQIRIGAEGVANGDKALRWSPSGNSLMVWSDWNLRITIWPLSAAEPKPVQLHHPKHGPNMGCTFSPTGRYFALICRQPGNYHDYLGVYDTLTWSCVSLFNLSTGLVDPIHLHWSPCGRYLAIVESALLDFRVEIWSPTGLKLGAFTPQQHRKLKRQLNLSSTDINLPTQTLNDHQDGSSSIDSSKRKDFSHTNNQESDTDGYVGLGIRHIKWRPGGEYLAVGGWDSKVRLLNDLTWTSICEIDLSEISNARVLNEPREWIARTRGHGIIPFDAESMSVLPSPSKADYSKPNPAIGIKDIEWSFKGDYMACRNDAMPCSIYIFSFRGPTHSTISSSESTPPHSTVPLRPRLINILNFTSPIKRLQWHPTLNQLVLCCATSAVYSWYPTQPGVSFDESGPSGYCEGIGVPAGIPFNPVLIDWAPTGKLLLLSDRVAFCLAFPIPEDTQLHQEDTFQSI